jgi:predicted PurR-regulated permease PerM
MSDYRHHHHTVSRSATIAEDKNVEDNVTLKRQNYAKRSISMATLKAQMSLAQSLRNFFQSARDPTNTNAIDTHTEDAWLQAIYNAVVFTMVGVVLCIVIAVYYILEPFLQPLLWAVLTGAFLFPFKHSSTTYIERWLGDINYSGIPLIAGLILSPISFFNFAFYKMQDFISKYWKIIIFLSVTSVIIHVATYSSVINIFNEASTFFHISFKYLNAVFSYTTYFQILLIIIGLPLLLWFAGNNTPKDFLFNLFAVIIWYVTLVNLANIFIGSSVGVPLVTLMFIVASIGYIVQGRNSPPVQENEESVSVRRKSVFVDAYDMIQNSIVLPSLSFLDHGNRGGSSRPIEATPLKDNDDYTDDVESVMTSDESIPRQSTVRFRNMSPSRKLAVPTIRVYDDEVDTSFHASIEPTDDNNVSNKIFVVLITLCVLLVMLHNPFLFLVFVPFAVIFLLKQLASLSIATSCYETLATATSNVYSWLYAHRAKLFPQPIPVLFYMCSDVDDFALDALKKIVGFMMSCFIILGLLVFSVCFSLFLIFQIQLEVTYTIGLATQVVNSSVANNSWISNVLGYDENETIQHHFQHFADQGFHAGREWLGNQIHMAVNDSTIKEEVLKLYDKLYHVYVFRNSSTCLGQLDDDPHIAMNGLRHYVWHEAKHIVYDNLETILSILKTLWTMNFSIVVSLLMTLSSIIFSGSTLVLNFIVFITTLFYLLAYSEDQYLPFDCLMSILPNAMTSSAQNDYADTFTRVIQSVFHASLRRACFYGLYTWLILSVFGMKIIILPSVLGALIGAVPFVGTYWVGLPAILQLWLIENSLFSAIVALVLLILPPFLIDSMINSEIEG